MNTLKKSYIETFGCQMNERDSEIMGQMLAEARYLPTADLKQADLIVINTCSIREKAEQKVYSLLGRLKKLKQKKPGLIITVAGCVAQQERDRLQARMDHVDIVIGPQHIYKLPQLVARSAKTGKSQLEVDLLPDFSIPRYSPPSPAEPIHITARPKTGTDFKKFVTIMQGCNNFCTYCVVPYTRGRETSRPPDDIIAEIEDLAASGTREITLLGQNVNSYGRSFQETQACTSFPELLKRIAAIEGIDRIRFTTSHPKDLSSDLIECFASVEKLCPHFHLPVQSGSNRILKRMNRKYTREQYLKKVAALKTVRPEIALTTDIIVGFPGETEEDFSATMELLETVRFHGAFSFKYSDRPQAKAIAFDDKITEPVKAARLKILQDRQNQITLDRNREYESTIQEVMVEGESKNKDGQFSGRTMSNIIVNFETPRPLSPGQVVQVQINEGLLHSLRGIVL